MPPRKPFFPLLDVKNIARRRDGLHLSKTKAEASFSSFATALDAARSMIELLTERDFVETKQQRDPTRAMSMSSSSTSAAGTSS